MNQVLTMNWASSIGCSVVFVMAGRMQSDKLQNSVITFSSCIQTNGKVKAGEILMFVCLQKDARKY